jgi:hypothetical protein
MLYWLIEEIDQLEEFLNRYYNEVFVEIIPYSNTIHPTQNDICAIYIRPLNSHKGFIIPLSHSEALSIDINEVERVLNTFKKIYVRDKKEFMHYFLLNALYDLTLTLPPYIQEYTPTHSFFYSKYPNKKDINRIIPIVKHYEYCEKTFNDLKHKADEPINDFYNNRATIVFNAVERSGIHIDKERFKQSFHDIDSDFVFTQYNFKTLTTRPSNKFNGINYAALNKENGDRQCFIPRNGFFVEVDVNGMHPRILSYLIKYDIKNEDIYSFLLNIYKSDRETAKKITFQQIYGGINPLYLKHEFFKKIQEYTDYNWDKFQINGYVECPISKYKFYKDKMDNMNPQKLLNYILQATETSINVILLWDILKFLRGKNSKIILYTYDSALIDMDKNESQEIIQYIKEKYNRFNLPLSIKTGDNYHDMKVSP